MDSLEIRIASSLPSMVYLRRYHFQDFDLPDPLLEQYQLKALHAAMCCYFEVPFYLLLRLLLKESGR